MKCEGESEGIGGKIVKGNGGKTVRGKGGENCEEKKEK